MARMSEPALGDNGAMVRYGWYRGGTWRGFMVGMRLCVLLGLFLRSSVWYVFFVEWGDYILICSLLSCKLLLDILDRPYHPFNMKRTITSTDKMTTKSCVNYSEKIYKNSKSSVSFKVETCHNRDWSEHFELIHDLQGSLLHTEAKTHLVMKTQTNFAHRAESSYPDIWFGI